MPTLPDLDVLLREPHDAEVEGLFGTLEGVVTRCVTNL
jgi:hypothetical protein